MPTLIEKIRTEPATVVSAVLAVLLLVGVTVSEENASLATQLLAALAPLIAGRVVRARVTPMASFVEGDLDYTAVETDGHPGNPV